VCQSFKLGYKESFRWFVGG